MSTPKETIQCVYKSGNSGVQMMNQRKSGNNSQRVEAILGVYFYANYESHRQLTCQMITFAMPPPQKNVTAFEDFIQFC